MESKWSWNLDENNRKRCTPFLVPKDSGIINTTSKASPMRPVVKQEKENEEEDNQYQIAEVTKKQVLANSKWLEITCL